MGLIGLHDAKRYKTSQVLTHFSPELLLMPFYLNIKFFRSDTTTKLR